MRWTSLLVVARRGPVASVRNFASSTIYGSAYRHMARKTLPDLYRSYEQGTSISVITAHDYLTALYADAAEMDVVLVGDSLANTTLGYEDTNQLPFEEFLYHVKAVHRGNSLSFLIADLPFGSFEQLPEQAIGTCMRLLKEGRVQAVKVEAGAELAPTIKRIVQTGIPVVGHVGLTPQRHNAFGGHKVQGNTPQSAAQIWRDCEALLEAGVFALLLECVPNKLAQLVTEHFSVPTIGIGAGPYCLGQVLVVADVLGMGDPHENKPKFAKLYASVYEESVRALSTYKRDGVGGSYPNADEQGFKMKRDVLEGLKQEIASRM